MILLFLLNLQHCCCGLLRIICIMPSYWFVLIGFVRFIFVLVAIISSMLVASLLGFGGGTHCRILFACLLWIGLMGFVQFIFVLIAIVSFMLVLSLLGFDGGAHRKFFCMFAWFALDFVVWTSEYYISTYIQDVILYILVGLSHKIKIMVRHM